MTEARRESVAAKEAPATDGLSRQLVTPEDKLAALEEHRYEAEHHASQAALDKQHSRGKLTARERIDRLVDKGTFVELDSLARHQSTGADTVHQYPVGDAVITGWGLVDGRKIFVFAQDFTVFGGSLGEVMSNKVCKIMDLAAKVGAPVVGLNDSGGARIQEGVVSLSSYGEIFYRNVKSSGVIPQISVIMGPCAGGAVYSPAMTDFVFMVKNTAHMFITGPDVIKAVTGETVTHEELGGAVTHASRSGVAQFVADDEEQCLEDVRYLLSFLPSNNAEEPPYVHTEDDPFRLVPELDTFLPSSVNQPYDVKELIRLIVDEGELFEVAPMFAQNIVTGFARLGGHVVGVVGNQPLSLAGTLDIDASDKAARFVRTCDAFNVPLVTLVDVPGFLPGTDQEHRGIIRHGAKLLYAYCEATVPRIQVIVRKCYGGAYVVLDSRSIGADISMAWPTAEPAVMGASGAVNIIYRREIENAADPKRKREELIAAYEDEYCTPYKAAERGLVDDVIQPSETRKRLLSALRMLATKRAEQPHRKHGNIPL